MSIENGLHTLFVPQKPINPEQPYQGEWIKTELNIYAPLGPHEVRISKKLIFYESPNQKSTVVAQVKLPSAGKRWLLLFVPNPNSKGYRIIPISEKNAPWQNYHIKNFTGKDLSVAIGNTIKVIKPGGTTTIKMNGGSKFVKITGIVKNKPRIIRQTKWRLDSNQRELIIYYRTKNGKIRYKHILEHKKDHRGDLNKKGTSSVKLPTDTRAVTFLAPKER